MTIREELRACAATEEVNPTQDLSSRTYQKYCAAGNVQDWTVKADAAHRATFLLLVAEAL